MTLVLEIDYLTGVAAAARGRGSAVPDWPPQPDRVFSALVASWAARGQREREARALRWLEAQAVPCIEASSGWPRSAPPSFVPPNDPGTGRSGNPAVLPAHRPRQPRRFPASRPDDPVVRLRWADADPDDETLDALCGLAADTAYVGHSASLTRCRFLRVAAVPQPEAALRPVRRVYPGRFDELCRDFAAGRRPEPGAPVAAAAAAAAGQDEAPCSLFSDRWLVLEHVSGDAPDLRACAVAAKQVRYAIMSGYGRIGHGDAIPEVVSGHRPDRSPARALHMAVVPLAFTGFPHADGHLMGFALVPPRGDAILSDPAFRRALRAVAPTDPETDRRVLRLGKAQVGLSPTLDAPAGRRSLDPALYTGASTTFATVTPIVLDRHLKASGAARDEEIAAQIAAACRNAGLPEPERHCVVADKHAALEGAPSAWPSGASPSWMRWRLPDSLASRQLTHAVLRFPVPVRGPVLLGAGRYVGLGLCRPLDDGEAAP